MSQKQRILGVLFFISLMANAFFVGLIAGHHTGFGPPPHESPLEHLLQASRGLPDDQKIIVKDVVAQQPKQDLDSMQPLFDQLKDALTAPTFDRARVEALHQQLATQDQTMKSAMESTVLTLGDKLSPAARIKLFKKMFDHGPGGPH